MTQMQAIKTEYKGVVFDSKSEAVFARLLDNMNIKWMYHPGFVKNHEWDFCILWERMRRGEWIKRIDLIEYKPRMPTKTYIENIIEKSRACNHSNYMKSYESGVITEKAPFRCNIVYGSLWDYKEGVKSPGDCFRSIPITSWDTVHRLHFGGDFNDLIVAYVERMDKYPNHMISNFWELIGKPSIHHVEDAISYRYDLA